MEAVTTKLIAVVCWALVGVSAVVATYRYQLYAEASEHARTVCQDRPVFLGQYGQCLKDHRSAAKAND